MPNEHKTSPRIRKKALASCVNFSESQYTEIASDSRLSGQSIPLLLKNAYFPSRRVRFLMDKDAQTQLFTELRHWGDKLDQLAQRVNSGVMSGWYEEFQLVTQAILRIETSVVRLRGNSHL